MEYEDVDDDIVDQVKSDHSTLHPMDKAPHFLEKILNISPNYKLKILMKRQ